VECRAPARRFDAGLPFAGENNLETHPVVPLESLPVILKKLEDQGL
jgi:hypothetical protein